MTATYVALALLFGGVSGMVVFGLLTILLGRFLPAARGATRAVDDETVVLLVGGAR